MGIAFAAVRIDRACTDEASNMPAEVLGLTDITLRQTTMRPAQPWEIIFSADASYTGSDDIVRVLGSSVYPGRFLTVPNADLTGLDCLYQDPHSSLIDYFDRYAFETDDGKVQFVKLFFRSSGVSIAEQHQITPPNGNKLSSLLVNPYVADGTYESVGSN